MGDTFDSVKAVLQRSRHVGAIKTDLFSHITEIINRIIAHHKYDAYQKFEEISLLVKKTQLKIKNSMPIEEFRKLSSKNANSELDLYVDTLRNLLNEKVQLSSSDKKFINKMPN
jgi:D-mannonate dehydratase